jgi:hypothetical protein
VKRPDGKVVNVGGFDQDSIQYLILKVFEKNGNEHVELVQTMITKGRLKKDIDISLHHISSGNPFICSILDNTEKVLNSFEFSNPLVEFVEYIDDNGMLQQKEIISTEKEFLVRIPYRKANTFLKLEKFTMAQEKGQELSHFKANIGVVRIN